MVLVELELRRVEEEPGWEGVSRVEVGLAGFPPIEGPGRNIRKDKDPVRWNTIALCHLFPSGPGIHDDATGPSTDVPEVCLAQMIFQPVPDFGKPSLVPVHEVRDRHEGRNGNLETQAVLGREDPKAAPLPQQCPHLRVEPRGCLSPDALGKSQGHPSRTDESSPESPRHVDGGKARFPEQAAPTGGQVGRPRRVRTQGRYQSVRSCPCDVADVPGVQAGPPSRHPLLTLQEGEPGIGKQSFHLGREQIAHRVDF